MSSDMVAMYMHVLAMAFCIIFRDVWKRHNKIGDLGGLTTFELSSLTGIKITHSFLNHVIGKNSNNTMAVTMMDDQNIQPDLHNN